MKEKWYNRPIPLKYLSIFPILAFILTLFLPIDDIECSKNQNVCNIYSRSVIFRTRKLTNQFKISDIDHYIIISSGGGRGGRRHYNPIIYLTNGDSIEINNRISSNVKAEEIVLDIKMKENYQLKGSYFKEIFGY